MKHLLFPASLFMMTMAFAGPEVIEPKTKTIRNVAWYSEQAIQWKSRISQNPSADAWLNYYAASRYSLQPQEDLDHIVQQAQQSIPGTFEAAVVKSWNEGFTDQAFNLLNDAYLMNPGHAATYGGLTLFHELKGNDKERTAFCKKLLESGQVSQALLSYSYNVLMSVENDAVLFTEGDNTTLPLFILQDVMDVRRDVIVLNLDILAREDYLMRKTSASGLTFSPASQLEFAADRKKLICTALPGQNQGRKFYYALTIGRENISDIRDQLYVVGLASQISKQRLDNISIIKQNLESRFLLDYLTVDFNGESEFSAGKVLSPNYLVPMLLLDDHYIKSGEREKARNLERVLQKVAYDGGKSDVVDQFLKREKPTPEFIAANIDIKKLEESFRIIRGNLYAMNEEVSNRRYNSFVDFLVLTNQTELYERCKIDLSKYEGTLLTFFKGYHTYIKEAGKGRAKDPFSDYPVVNISHEAATAYCEWLTEQYNHASDKKFKKVKFRLPTINEWQIAALGYDKFQSWELDKNEVPVVIPKDTTVEIEKRGKPVMIPATDVSYPWFGAYNYRNKVQNHWNCFLANVKAPEDCKPCATPSIGKDGYSMMGRNASYFPNGMGLYDPVGNVAEMIDEKGKACGGSWNHPPNESTIRSVYEYKEPDAAVGFRIFMEVTEK